MKIRHLNVEPAWGASGVQGFFETDKYWYHKLFAVTFVMWFLFHTFVAKTTTLRRRLGNMPLADDGVTPKEWVPRCIVVNWPKRAVLNAVGLSGFGLEHLLSQYAWQARKKDFFISLMSVASSAEERREEIADSVRILLDRVGEFRASFGIQLNVSCPNVGASYKSIVVESDMLLDAIEKVDAARRFVVVVKLAPTVHALEAATVAKHPRCDGLCIGNTVPYGQLAGKIDWVGLFGSADPKQSPLIKRGFGQSGGYSGKQLLPVVCDLIREIRDFGVRTHINACGGILGPFSAIKAMNAGADSISIGSGAILAPWGVLPAIVAAHMLVWFRFNFTKEVDYVTA